MSRRARAISQRPIINRTIAPRIFKPTAVRTAVTVCIMAVKLKFMETSWGAGNLIGTFYAQERWLATTRSGGNGKGFNHGGSRMGTEESVEIALCRSLCR